jgi:GNAT superfamily N-acetyltransferase
MISQVNIRNTKRSDFDSIRALQQKVYPHLKPWLIEQLENHIKVFPEGQLVAEFEGKIVGTSSSLIIFWEEYGPLKNFGEITGKGTFNTHTPEGKTLYGAEVCVDPDLRKRGIGKKIYAARRKLCKQLNLKRIIAAGRIPNYHKYADRFDPHTYAMHVIWGDIYDPVLRFQTKEGFQFCDIIENYLTGDKDSLENATLIVWLNHDYKPGKGERNESKNSRDTV